MNEMGRYGAIYGLPRNGGNCGSDYRNGNNCNGIAGKDRREYGVPLLHFFPK
jgi:hypothetical protein